MGRSQRSRSLMGKGKPNRACQLDVPGGAIGSLGDSGLQLKGAAIRDRTARIGEGGIFSTDRQSPTASCQRVEAVAGELSGNRVRPGAEAGQVVYGNLAVRVRYAAVAGEIRTVYLKGNRLAADGTRRVGEPRRQGRPVTVLPAGRIDRQSSSRLDRRRDRGSLIVAVGHQTDLYLIGLTAQAVTGHRSGAVGLNRRRLGVNDRAAKCPDNELDHAGVGDHAQAAIRCLTDLRAQIQGAACKGGCSRIGEAGGLSGDGQRRLRIGRGVVAIPGERSVDHIGTGRQGDGVDRGYLTGGSGEAAASRLALHRKDHGLTSDSRAEESPQSHLVTVLDRPVVGGQRCRGLDPPRGDGCRVEGVGVQ